MLLILRLVNSSDVAIIFKRNQANIFEPSELLCKGSREELDHNTVEHITHRLNSRFAEFEAMFGHTLQRRDERPIPGGCFALIADEGIPEDLAKVRGHRQAAPSQQDPRELPAPSVPDRRDEAHDD